MRQLERNAFIRLPLPYEAVEEIYGNVSEADSKSLRALCESHERLRAETRGLETLNQKLENTAGSLPSMLEALKVADEFIRNGVEFGFIRMPDPDTNDRATRTPGIIRAAIIKAEGGAA